MPRHDGNTPNPNRKRRRPTHRKTAAQRAAKGGKQGKGGDRDYEYTRV
jgi:hypothetical protein